MLGGVWWGLGMRCRPRGDVRGWGVWVIGWGFWVRVVVVVVVEGVWCKRGTYHLKCQEFPRAGHT